MDLLLLLPLTLSLLTTVPADTNDGPCFPMCPPGSYKVGKCANDTIRCRRCENGTYTALENSLPKCLRCSKCDWNAEEIKACVPESDVGCVCKKGFYTKTSDDNAKFCKPCPCEYCKRNANRNRCKECNRWRTRQCGRCVKCLNDTECSRQCNASMNSTTAGITGPTSMHAPSTTAMNPPKSNQIPWLFLAGAVAALLVLLWLSLLCLEKPIRLPAGCPCWSANKEQELPGEELKSNEQFSHEDSCPNIMIFDTSEESPVLNLSPGNQEHPLLPGNIHKDEQSEHWPAIVLYAIIKEVPLRRWKEFLRLLLVSDQQMERVELEAGLNSMERQYQMLRLWSQRSSASLSDVLSALHYMELSGCAQQLQESLEKMHWTPEPE